MVMVRPSGFRRQVIMGSLGAGLMALSVLLAVAAKPPSAAEPNGPLPEVSIEVDARKGGKEIGSLKRGILVSPKISEYVWHKYVKEVGVRGGIVRLPLDFEWMHDPSVLDPWLARVRAAGGEPLLFVSGVPAALSRSVPGSLWRTGVRRAFDVTPENLEKWQDLVRQAILHYNRDKRFQIKYLEVWNEPDLPVFWSGTEADFLSVYRATVTAALAADPTIRVGGPAVASWSAGIGRSGPFIKTFLDFAQRNRLPVDFISWHAFEKDPLVLRAAVKQIQAWKKTFGFPGAELFLDEWNYGPPNMDREGPIGAAYVGAMMPEILAAGIDRQAFSYLQDIDTARADFGGDDFGLLTLNGIEKPAYNAFRAINMLGNVQLETIQTGGEHFVSHIATRSEDLVAVLVSHFPPPDPLLRADAFFFNELGYARENLRGWGIDDRVLRDILRPDGDRVVDGLRAPDKAKADLKKAVNLYRRLNQEIVMRGGRWRVRVAFKHLPFQSKTIYERYLIDARNSNSFAARDKIAAQVASLRDEARAKALEGVERFTDSPAVEPTFRQSLHALIAEVKSSDVRRTERLLDEFQRKHHGRILDDLKKIEALYAQLHAEHMRKGIDAINEWPEVNLTRIESIPHDSGTEFATSFTIQPYSVTVVLLKRQEAVLSQAGRSGG